MTADVDAIFKPSTEIRELAAEIAKENNLPKDWLNDGAKGYFAENFQRNEVVNLSNLLVWVPEPKCMLAMKCISARWDTSDKDDVEFLIKHIGLKDAQTVLKNIDQFYPKRIVPAKTQFFIEELMESLK